MAKIERKPISYSEVKEFFDYNDGVLYWKKKVHGNTRKLGDRVGRIGMHGRCIIGFNRNTYYASRIIFIWHHGWLPDCIDHIDCNPLNDRIENLRAANFSENSRNRSSAKGSTSKYLGVYLHIDKKRPPVWTAIIRIGKRMKRLGGFITQELAAMAYNSAAVKHWGEFANLNIIQPK